MKAHLVTNSYNRRECNRNFILAVKPVQRPISSEALPNSVKSFVGFDVVCPPSVDNLSMSVKGGKHEFRNEGRWLKCHRMMLRSETMRMERGRYVRRPKFTEDDYVRLLHVVAQVQMMSVRQKITNVRTRDDLVGKRKDLWTNYFAPMTLSFVQGVSTRSKAVL